jgi:hypothetical protein
LRYFLLRGLAGGSNRWLEKITIKDSRFLLRLILFGYQTKRIKRTGHVSRLGEKRNVYRIFIGAAEGKRTFGYSRHRHEDNIKMCLKQSGNVLTEFAWLRIELYKSYSCL